MQPGTKLKQYTILSAIGKGGMGEVWKARDTKLGRDVALKTLPAEFARDADRLSRFDREARLLASLNHPNIASIYGFEEMGGARFIVLEMVVGETLFDRLKRGPIPAQETVMIGLQIVEALDAAAEKGIIHRDIKSGNIMIDARGHIKVLDFGVAKLLPHPFSEENSTVNSLNTHGAIVGTPQYLSPEVLQGMPVDARCDLWALG